MFAQCLNKGSRKLYRVGTNINQFRYENQIGFSITINSHCVLDWIPYTNGIQLVCVWVKQ